MKILNAFLLLLLSSPFLFSQNIIWEEQFDGGIPITWQIGPGAPEGAVWQWSSTGMADSALVNEENIAALFWGSRDPIDSPSAANGCAMYNSDVYDGGGITVGAGPYPGTHSGSLTSPSIDLTGQDAVTLVFHQYARANASMVSTLVEVSNDGGETWTDFPFNEEIVGNGSTEPNDIVILNISSVAANQADVKIRFTWNGRYYFWLIDDVQIVETPKYNLALGDYLYPPSSFAQPALHWETDTMYFSADVSNIGGEDQTNVVLKVIVSEGETGITIHQDSVIRDIIEVDSTYTLSIAEPYIPDNIKSHDTYRFTYDVYSLEANEPDFNPNDNHAAEQFYGTFLMLAKDDGNGIGGIRPQMEGDWEIGNLYEISPLAWWMDARSVGIRAARSISDGGIQGAQVSVFLYQIDDVQVEANLDSFDINIPSTSLEAVGFNTVTFPAEYENFDLITVDLLDINTFNSGVQLEPGARYILSILYSGVSANVFHGVDNDINYFQVSTVLATDQWFLGGFGPSEAAVIQLNPEMIILDAEEEVLPEYVLRLSPNPTSDFLNVNLDLATSEDALITIASMDGKILDMVELENIQQHSFQLDIQSYTSGTYWLRVGTKEGTRTKKFVVIK
jgi:hypothetical protein